MPSRGLALNASAPCARTRFRSCCARSTSAAASLGPSQSASRATNERTRSSATSWRPENVRDTAPVAGCAKMARHRNKTTCSNRFEHARSQS